MKNVADFDTFLRELMARKRLHQKQLAKELDVSPSILSYYITGKNIPEMEFLEKCVNYFDLKGKKLKTLFKNAFFSTAQNNHKIILDTRYFREERLETLIQIITILLLYSDRQSLPAPGTNHPLLINLFKSIESSFDAMDNDEFLELLHPIITEK